MAKNKDNRLSFSFSEFYVDNLKLENNTIYFGSNLRVEDLTKLLNVDIRTLNKKAGTDYTESQILDDDQLAEIAMAFDYGFEKVDDVSEENVLSKINNLVLNKD
jgi:PhoPQ-activated pathogenicity-related protein